jgi:hypothetical protein
MMPLQDIVILVSLTLAACGHLLVHEVRRAAAVWNWLDGHFPEAWRSAPSIAGAMLLVFGGLGVLVPVLG